MRKTDHYPTAWLDAVLLVFLAGLAVLPPVADVRKQLVLLVIGIIQLMEARLTGRLPKTGAAYAVILKILLATLLMMYTSALPINSPYYPIYYLPVVTAAIYFGPWMTLVWTAVASAAYCSLLLPALQEYQLTAGGITELAIRILFLFLAGALVNRFAVENRRHVQQYQRLTETLSDTNRRLELAQQEARRGERLAALGQLSAGLAHEIRNPLGIIKGSAEILRDKLESSSTLSKNLADNIYSEVNRLSALVARFLDFARPSQLQVRPQQIAPLVDRGLKAAHDQYPGDQVSLERDYADNLPDLLLDDDLCEQVFVNLALNAYEAMQPGGGALEVRIAQQDELVPASGRLRPCVVVTVQDSGRGIAPDLREQIFNPFVTTKSSGAGLGLAVVAKIVGDHGGWIRATNQSGSGAQFQVCFPVEEK